MSRAYVGSILISLAEIYQEERNADPWNQLGLPLARVWWDYKFAKHH